MSNIDVLKKNPYTFEELETISDSAWNASQTPKSTSWCNEYIDGWTSYTIQVGRMAARTHGGVSLGMVSYVQSNWEFNGVLESQFFADKEIDNLTAAEMRNAICKDYAAYCAQVDTILEIEAEVIAGVAAELENWQN